MYTWIPLPTISDLDQLTSHVSVEFNPEDVVAKLKKGISSAVKNVLIEHNYIDKDYRSTLYAFYAKKGQYYRSDCVRLHFFDESVKFERDGLRLKWTDKLLENHYFGYMVLRPTGIGTIGRSVVSPDVRSGVKGGAPIIHARHKVHLLGHKMAVEGFPSMDQHVDISVCAHAACWSILRHYSERYTAHREYLTHDITMMAQQFDPGGLVPSKGLEVSNAERVFQAAGTYPYLVARKGNSAKTDPSFYRQLIGYVESGFPLFAAMHQRGHAIAIVGYEWKAVAVAVASTAARYVWDEIQNLIVVDDNYLPYLSVPTTPAAGNPYSAEDIDSFIVALPEKIFYPADAVDRISTAIFKFAPLMSLPAANDSVIRYLIATASGLRDFVRERESEFDPKLIELIMSLPFAQFVWIVEIATQADWSKGQIAARAVLDATASLREDVPFWLIHNRDKALVFDRRVVRGAASRLKALNLTGMHGTALTRMDRNLRPTQSK